MNSVYLILLLIPLNRKLAQCFPVTTARVRLGTSFKTFASGHPHFKEARFLSHILSTLPSGREEVGIQVIISCSCASFTESNIIPVDEKRRVSINRLQVMFACVRANVRVTSFNTSCTEINTAVLWTFITVPSGAWYGTCSTPVALARQNVETYTKYKLLSKWEIMLQSYWTI